MAYNPTHKYAWYIRGRDLALVQFDAGSGTDTEYKWRTVTEGISAGLQIEYSKSPTIPTDETSTMDINDTLCHALISYLKAKQFEREGQIQMHDYFMKDFWRLVAINENNKIVGPRKIIPTGTEVIK
jgi:hypothetical protein